MLQARRLLIMSNGDNQESDMPKATMKIETSTRDRLAKMGAKNDTFDSIIVRLMDEHDKKKR